MNHLQSNSPAPDDRIVWPTPREEDLLSAVFPRIDSLVSSGRQSLSFPPQVPDTSKSGLPELLRRRIARIEGLYLTDIQPTVVQLNKETSQTH